LFDYLLRETPGYCLVFPKAKVDMAGLLSSRVFDRLSIETAKLKVSDNAIKTGALNEIKTQITD
jgi:hypothetical protein